MSPIYLRNGALLIENGALAISANCCCNEVCCNCPSGSVIFVPDYWSAYPVFPCSTASGDSYYNQFSSCSGLGWSATVPELPERQLISDCSFEGDRFYWASQSTTYIFGNYFLSSWINGNSPTSGTFFPWAANSSYIEAYLDWDKLANDYDNCNLYLIYHLASTTASEYQCAASCGPTILGSYSVSENMCLRIVQIIPDECEMDPPGSTGATLRDITDDVWLSGNLPYTGISGELDGTCSKLFLGNVVVDLETCMGDASNTEALDGHVPPIYVDPIIVEPIVLCGVCPEE